MAAFNIGTEVVITRDTQSTHLGETGAVVGGIDNFIQVRVGSDVLTYRAAELRAA